eukprot:COSAG02_NODE_5403_length_4357_cov_3.183185_8_plen_175_part_00
MLIHRTTSQNTPRGRRLAPAIVQLEASTTHGLAERRIGRLLAVRTSSSSSSSSSSTSSSNSNSGSSSSAAFRRRRPRPVNRAHVVGLEREGGLPSPKLDASLKYIALDRASARAADRAARARVPPTATATIHVRVPSSKSQERVLGGKAMSESLECIGSESNMQIPSETQSRIH